MPGLDINYITTKTKLNFLQNDKLITSNFLKNDEVIYEGSGEDLQTKINFSLHISRLKNLKEGNYSLKIHFIDNLFSNIFIKEISPSKTEIRIGLSEDKNNDWTIWCYNPSIFWEDFNRTIFINNRKYRIINAIPDYNKANTDLEEIQNKIDSLDKIEEKIEIEKLKNKRDIACGKTTFILKLEKEVITSNNNLPIENKNTFLAKEVYDSMYYEDVYVYESTNDDKPIIELSNEYRDDLTNYYNTSWKNYDDLMGSYSGSLRTYLSSSLKNGITDLNIDYEKLSDFNYFGSAEQKIKNAYSKIEEYQTISRSMAELSYNAEASSSRQDYQIQMNEIEDNLSLFEYYVFEKSGSYAWPKKNGNKGKENNYFYSSSTVQNWYITASNNAKDYDRNNNNILTRNIPQRAIEEDNSKNLENILYVWGDFFDEIKCYINQIPYFWNINHDKIDSIPDSLLDSFGNTLQQPMYEGYDGKELEKYILGKNLSSGSIKLREATREKWRRLLDNLPYLNKIKGTKRSIKSLLNIYGIPTSILKIREYGGGNKTSGSAYIEEDKNVYVLNINDDKYLRIPSASYQTISGSDFTYEMRFETDKYLNMDLFGNNGFTVSLITGSNDNSGSLKVSTSDIATSASWSNVWYNNWNYVYLKREGSTIEVGSKRYKDNQLFINISSSETILSQSNFDTGSIAGNYVYFGSGSFSGSMQEIRIWNTALSDNELDHHAMDFDSLAMTSYSAVDNYLQGHWKLDDNRDLGSNAYVNDYNRTVDKYDADVFNYNDNEFRNTTLYDVKTEFTNFNPQLYSDNKVFIGYNHTGSSMINSNRVDLLFSPTEYMNKDIQSEFAMLDFNDTIGNPLDMYEMEYETLKTWREYYYKKFTGNYNFYAFIKFIRNFDKSVFKLARELVPERAELKSGLIIRPNILERSKYKWEEPTISTHDYSSSINIDDYEEVTQSLDEDLNDKFWTTGSMSSEYSFLTASYEWEETGSGATMPFYDAGSLNFINDQLDRMTYIGSMNTTDNDYHNAPVQVSESAGTIVRVS